MWKNIFYKFSKSINDIKIIPLNSKKTIINEVHINNASALGEVISNTSLIRINSVVCLLGGDPNRENILSFSNKINNIFSLNKLVIAYDVFGGLFSVDTVDSKLDNIAYYAPDSLEWVSLDINYNQFLEFLCSDRINQFYSSFMWKNMNKLTDKLESGQAILIYPFLWSKECNIETANKEIVDIFELTRINFEFQMKLDQGL